MFKKCLSVLLAVIMALSLLTVLPVSVPAAENNAAEVGLIDDAYPDFEYLVNEGEAEITKYTGTESEVNIPSTLGGYPVTRIGYAFEYCAGLTNIYIPDSVTSINNQAFRGCTGLTSIVIPDSVTTIDYSTFGGCTGLTSVVIGNSVMSISSSAFDGCSRLTSIMVSDGNPVFDSRNNCNAIIKTESNTLFLGCKKTVIPDSVTAIGISAFYGCTGLTSIVIPDSVTSIYNMAFYGCTSLTSIIIPHSVTKIGEAAFYNCISLTSIDIPSTIKTILGYTFYGCTNLKSINIPDSVKIIGGAAFCSCTSLTSINIPDSISKIGGRAFEGCTNLSEIVFTDSVTNIGWIAFDKTAWLNEQPDGLIYIGRVLYAVKGDCTETVIIKPGTTAINDYAFRNQKSLTSVIIPDSVSKIGECAFEGCSNLKSVDFGNGVLSIGSWSFAECSSLSSITLPNTICEICEYAFKNCIMLKLIDFHDKLTIISDNAFSGTAWYESQEDGPVYINRILYCVKGDITVTEIKEGTISIPNSVVTSKINIPDSVCYIGGGNNKLDKDTFGVIYAGKVAYDYNGEKSGELIIAADTTGIRDSVFWNNSSTGFTKVTIPDSVKVIGRYAFAHNGLTEAIIPEGVEIIEYSAFWDNEMKEITIPASVKFIDNNAIGYYYEGQTSSPIDGFTIKGYYGSAAERYAYDNGFKFIALDAPAEHTVTDDNSGISVTLTDNTELNVVEITDSTLIGNDNLIINEKVVAAYDIELTKSGEKVQPEAAVQVKMPCSDENAKVYRIESDGTLTDMNAVYEDGYLVFYTDHFSVYIVAVTKPALLGDADGSYEVDSVDATIVQRVATKLTVPYSEAQLMNADIDGDGDLTVVDATFIQRYAIKVATPYKIGDPMSD